jgi:hypothetical protein
MTAASSAFARALRAKYGGDARAALRALGLDENLISRENLMATNKAPSKFANFAMQLVANAIAPVLSKDAKIDLMPVFKDVTAKSFKAAPLKLALDSALKGKLAADAEVGMGHVAQMLDHIEHVAGEGRDESVSPEQHAAMEAAAHGESSLGIPKKAGDKKFGWDAEKVEGFKRFMRENGVAEDDILDACDLLGIGQMPASGAAGGAGGALSGQAADRGLAYDGAARDCEEQFGTGRIGAVMGDQEVIPPPSVAAAAAISDIAGCADRISTSPF